MHDFPLIWMKIRDYVTASLAVALVVTSLGWYITNLNLKNEKLGRKNDAAQFEKAQQKAEADHLRAKAEKERQYDELKEKGDRAYSDLLSKYDAAVLRYKTSTSQNSYANLSRAPESTGSPQGVAEDPLIPVRESDLLICAENTAKVVVMYDWLKNIEGIKDKDASQKGKK